MIPFEDRPIKCGICGVTDQDGFHFDWVFIPIEKVMLGLCVHCACSIINDLVEQLEPPTAESQFRDSIYNLVVSVNSHKMPE